MTDPAPHPTPIPIVPLFRYVNPRTLNMSDPAIYEAVCAAIRHSMRRLTQPKVRALLAAGWRLELASLDHDSEPWQWQFRRPVRRRDGRGKLFLSTDQAFDAFVRQTPRG